MLSKSLTNRLTRGALRLLCATPLLAAVSCAPAGDAPSVAAPVEVAYHPQVVGGKLLLVSDTGDTRSIDLPVRPERAFGLARGRVLFTAEPRHVKTGTDEIGGENLWSVALDGSDAQRLTEEHDVLRATFSDALGGIVYWTRDMRILFLAEGAEAAQVLAVRAAMPAVSPDGSRIAYSKLPASWEEGSLPGGFDLHVIDTRTGEDREISSGYDDADPIWTPDSRRILFISGGRTGLTSFYRVDASGEHLTQISNVNQTEVGDDFVPNPSANTDVRWSPDGSTLLYGARYTPEGEVTALDFDSEHKVRGVRALGAGRFPAWTASGTVITLRQEADSVRLFELSPSGSELRTFARLSGVLVDPPESAALDIDDGTAGKWDDVQTAGPGPHRFRLPLASNPGYSAYYDNDSGPGIKDWKCGSNTYNGHKGTDFLASNGTSVYAGDSGTVIYRNDGCGPGGQGNMCGGGFGNYVKIDHGASWYSIYAHLQSGTPIGYVNVSCGTLVGKSGMSGNVTGYHLHFEVQRYAYPWNDPFAGGCSGAESFWTNQNNGWPTTQCH